VSAPEDIRPGHTRKRSILILLHHLAKQHPVNDKDPILVVTAASSQLASSDSPRRLDVLEEIAQLRGFFTKYTFNARFQMREN
jgi:hypothetical protein